MQFHLIESNNDALQNIDNLFSTYIEYNALLVRGATIDLEKFERLTNFFCKNFHSAGGRASMRQNEGDGFTTQVWPDNREMLAHSEGAYRPTINRPNITFFSCVQPPSVSGGETTFFDGKEMLELIPTALRNRFEAQGVIYEMSWERERWSAEFNVYDTTKLKRFLSDFPGVNYSLKGENLQLFYASPAICCEQGIEMFSNGILNHLPAINHPAYKEKNLITKASNAVYFGNGDPLSHDVINTLIDIQDQVVHKHNWQKHDLVIVNNIRYMHGRKMTKEPCERKMLARFGQVKSEH